MLTPRETPTLHGQAQAEAALVAALQSGRLPHAWLFAGPNGVGKATLAYRFARALFAGKRDTLAIPRDHPVARRVAAGSHADLLVVERAWDDKRRRMKRDIAAEDARRIPDFLHLTPAEAGWRAVIVDGADALNRHSENALLKVLEEPPARAVLILVCDTPGGLLPTIRSRCRRLDLRQLDEAAMRAVLAEQGVNLPPEPMARLLAVARGSPGRAMALASGEGLALADLAGEVLGGQAIGGLRAYQIGETVARVEDGFALFMELLREGVAASARAAALGGSSARPLAAPLAAWGTVWEQLGKLQDEALRANLDKRQAVVAGIGLLSGP